MKIAIATIEGTVAEHFGRCPEYTLASIEEGRVKHCKTLDNPGHEPGFLPRFLSEHGVDCILAGGMGPRAQQLFNELDIKVVTGVSGAVEQVLSDFLAGDLEIGDDACHH